MLPRIDANLRPVAPSEGARGNLPATDARQGTLQRALQGLVGQNVPAQVQTRFGDGTALVRVAEQNVRMMLPSDVKVGADLSLTVLSASPRPTFQLGSGTAGATVVYPDSGEQLPSQTVPAQLPGAARPGGSGAPMPGNLPLPAGADTGDVAADDASAAAAPGNRATGGTAADGVRPQSLAATLLGKAPLTASADLPALDHTTQQATLSATARALTTMLAPAAGQTAQLALIGKTALFGKALPDTDELTQKLHDTISKSGLFYESHVTEWVKGQRSLADLMREPQMQRMAQQQGNEALTRLAGNGPDLTAAQMVNQQLHTQEQGRVQWQGEAWPGQPMQWEVRREQGREGQQGRPGAQDDEPAQLWRSGVRFSLPMLGKVAATVTMIGDQVHVQVETGSDDAAGTLRAYAGRFEAAMAAAGATLSSLAIAAEADASPQEAGNAIG